MDIKNTMSAPFLMSTALLLTILIVVGLLQKTNYAVADGSINGEGFTMLSVDSGTGTELLYVIDDKSSMLMVYSIPEPQSRKFIKPEASWLLPSLFNSVRN